MDWLENQKRFPGIPSPIHWLRGLLALIVAAVLKPDAWLA